MFEKVNNTHYICKDVNKIDSFIKEQINKISLGKMDDYNEVLNKMLYEQLLSRYVSSIFLEEIGELNDQHHTSITISINNTNYNITVGTFNMKDQLKYLNGIIEL